jgi:hypothetical protein
MYVSSANTLEMGNPCRFQSGKIKTSRGLMGCAGRAYRADEARENILIPGIRNGKYLLGSSENYLASFTRKRPLHGSPVMKQILVVQSPPLSLT